MKGSPDPNINTYINTHPPTSTQLSDHETHPPHKYDHHVQACFDCGTDVHLTNNDGLGNECSNCGTVYDGNGWLIERPGPARDE